MNKKTKAKIKAIIRKDANHTKQYFGPKPGQCCVIGGLITAIGLKPKTKPKWNTSGFTGLPLYIRARLSAAFGLSAWNLVDMQGINDRTTNTKYRRKKLICFIDSL